MVEELDECLKEIRDRDANFYHFAPIVIEIAEKIDYTPTDLAVFIELLTQHNMVAVGIRTKHKELIDYMRICDIALLPEDGDEKIDALTIEKQKNSTAQINHAPLVPMFISKVIEADEQVYSQRKDLIISGIVKHNAEVISDNNVFVYNQVQGKVFAGISGNEQAIIFIHQFAAQLVCIAGVYRVFKTLPEAFENACVKVSLHQGKLKFDVL